MERKSFEDMACSVAQCLEVVGEWWSMLLIRDAFLGVRRFDEFQERLGISRNVLTQRLTKLVEEGVLQKQPYQHNPVRYEYLLTDKGRDLWPVLTSMRQWGDRHAAPNGPPVRVFHRACEHDAGFELRCAHCGEKVTHRDVRVEPVKQRKRA
jgi:DNA-binding HxlR family transcriptional regulator